ncbi:YqjK family protein [Halomonas urmiana]|uniref:YqjK family protein n=1 Tax=Halomonas urmiana TaxID=490901 RepID=UPI0013053405|nr:YqjK family protein [Halomonas urmiana]
MNRAERLARRAELEHAIEQQRIDLLVAAHRWRTAERALDQGWQLLVRFKTPLLMAGGLLAYRGLRHPGGAARLARRLTAGALFAKKARDLLR